MTYRLDRICTQSAMPGDDMLSDPTRSYSEFRKLTKSLFCCPVKPMPNRRS